MSQVQRAEAALHGSHDRDQARGLVLSRVQRPQLCFAHHMPKMQRTAPRRPRPHAAHHVCSGPSAGHPLSHEARYLRLPFHCSFVWSPRHSSADRRSLGSIIRGLALPELRSPQLRLSKRLSTMQCASRFLFRCDGREARCEALSPDLIDSFVDSLRLCEYLRVEALCAYAPRLRRLVLRAVQ